MNGTKSDNPEYDMFLPDEFLKDSGLMWERGCTVLEYDWSEPGFSAFTTTWPSSCS